MVAMGFGCRCGGLVLERVYLRAIAIPREAGANRETDPALPWKDANESATDRAWDMLNVMVSI